LIPPTPSLPNRPHSLAEPAILIPFLAITLIWSSTWIVIKDQLGAGAEAVPAAWSVTYRFVIASAGMFAMAWLSGARIAIGRAGHGLALAIGVPQFVFNFQLVYAAEHHVTTGIVAVVFALLVVPNALLARLFFGQRVSRQFLLGSAVAMVGVALLFWAELRLADTRAVPVLVGIGLTLLAVLSASIGNLLQLAERVKRLPVASLLAWATFYGALVNGAIAAAMHGSPQVEMRASYWFGLIYLGLFASALAFFFYYRIIRAIGPAKAAYSSVLVPIVAMLISTAFEDYRWTALAAAGGVLAVAGLLVALSGRRPAELPPIAD
jgi:drug/metabolite transporter (DMT)-like permease